MINFMKKFENLILLIYGMTKRTNRGKFFKIYSLLIGFDNIIY